MIPSGRPNPRVDIEISMDPPTHSFSWSSPPTAKLRVVSRAEGPLTIFTYGKPLHLKEALTRGGFVITDTATELPVETSRIMVQRPPLKRTRGGPDEEYLLTLLPGTPVELSTGFGRGAGMVKPQPRAVVERGRELDRDGNETNIRPAVHATGVDGLEPGHEYRVGLDMEALGSSWWAPVAKEHVLVHHAGEGSYAQDYPWRKTPLEFHVRPTTLSVFE